MDIAAPAKLNLFLAVIGRRSDGYHNIVTVMCPVGLHDRVTLKDSHTDITVACTHPQVPENGHNLAHRAAALFFRHVPQSSGVHITIDKHIPVGAGLGGGSSDAAAVLRGLNQRYHRPFDAASLARLAAEIGADVPFFIYGRAAVARGVGHDLDHGLTVKPYHVVIVMPDISVSTSMIYRNLDLGLTKCEKKLKSIPLKKRVYDAASFLCNDLEAVTQRHHPEIEDLKAALLAEGASGALMTGSGAAVFGLYTDAGRAESARRAIQRRQIGTVYLTELVPHAKRFSESLGYL